MTPEEELVMEQTYKLTVHKLQEIANAYCKDKDAEIKKANERIKELEDYKLALSDLVESVSDKNALYKIRINELEKQLLVDADRETKEADATEEVFIALAKSTERVRELEAYQTMAEMQMQTMAEMQMQEYKAWLPRKLEVLDNYRKRSIKAEKRIEELEGALLSLQEDFKRLHPDDGDWWCDGCEEYLDSSRVTYEETCDTCGAACRWVHVADMGDERPREEPSHG